MVGSLTAQQRQHVLAEGVDEAALLLADVVQVDPIDAGVGELEEGVEVTARVRRGEQGLGDVLVTVGGIIPDDDIPALKDSGVAEVFGPGTTIAQVAEFLRANARPRG